jgi:hypothetical protein
MSDIQGEFGGSNPISLGDYYGADSGVPGSGAISISDFYGKSSERVLGSGHNNYQNFTTRTNSHAMWQSHTGAGIDAEANWNNITNEAKLGWHTYNTSEGSSSGNGTAKMKMIYCTYYIQGLFNSPALSAADAGKTLQIRSDRRWYRDNNVGDNTCPFYFQNQNNVTQKSLTLTNDTPQNIGDWVMSLTLSAENNGQVAFRMYCNGGAGVWRDGNMRVNPSTNGNDWVLV